MSAIVPVDLERSGLGWRRTLAGPFAGRCSVLAATVDRLLACKELREIALVCADVDAARGLLEPRQLGGGRVRIEKRSGSEDRRRSQGIAAGRLWARSCWRGGLGDLTCFDELFDPRECVTVMNALGADAALLVGADWAAVDPELCGQVIRRYGDHAARHRLTFTQAVPGLCGCVVARSLAEDLAKDGAERFPAATIGGLLGYLPWAPINDLIANPICLGVAGAVRDCGLRLIADTGRMRAGLERVLGDPKASAEGIASRLWEEVRGDTAGSGLAGPAPEELVIASGEGVSGRVAELKSLIREFGSQRPDGVVTFGDGRSDPFGSAQLGELIDAARAAGVAGIHVRTGLRDAGPGAVQALAASGVDVISVAFPAAGESGREGFRSAFDSLVAARRKLVGDDGLGVPWVVPRLTRCDANYGEVEGFVNAWVSSLGWAVLDPLDAARPGERISALPLPTSAAERLLRTRRTL